MRFLSPVTAVFVGWIFLQQTLTPFQIVGAVLVIGSIWLGQHGSHKPLPVIQSPEAGMQASKADA